MTWFERHRFSKFRNLLICVFLSIYIRGSVSLFPYSGEGTPPRFGDFEAHRYWSSVALHVRPISAWYEIPKTHWVIDYPPLSAFLAWAIGIVAKSLGLQEAVAPQSYGYESDTSRAFFRDIVLLLDLLFFFPAAYFASERDLFRFVFLTLLQPCWVLIDHGHFHYTCIQLGLLLWMVARYRTHKLRALALAVLFKQTSLYFLPIPAADTLLQIRLWAPPIVDITSAILIGCVVLYPFHISSLLQRIFPFERGVFEDKVATFWCTISPALRRLGLLKSRMLPFACGVLTGIAILPFLVTGRSGKESQIDRQHLCIRFTGCALAFYLFSYHVHEKHVLLPLLPLSLCIREEPATLVWASATATLSLFPLLMREGSGLACVILTLWMCLGIGHRPSAIWMLIALPLAFLLVLDVNPFSERYPDLLPYLIAAFCFCNFFGLLLWCYARNAKIVGAPFNWSSILRRVPLHRRFERRLRQRSD